MLPWAKYLSLKRVVKPITIIRVIVMVIKIRNGVTNYAMKGIFRDIKCHQTLNKRQKSRWKKAYKLPHEIK